MFREQIRAGAARRCECAKCRRRVLSTRFRRWTMCYARFTSTKEKRLNTHSPFCAARTCYGAGGCAHPVLGAPGGRDAARLGGAPAPAWSPDSHASGRITAPQNAKPDGRLRRPPSDQVLKQQHSGCLPPATPGGSQPPEGHPLRGSRQEGRATSSTHSCHDGLDAHRPWRFLTSSTELCSPRQPLLRPQGSITWFLSPLGKTCSCHPNQRPAGSVHPWPAGLGGRSCPKPEQEGHRASAAPRRERAAVAVTTGRLSRHPPDALPHSSEQRVERGPGPVCFYGHPLGLGPTRSGEARGHEPAARRYKVTGSPCRTHSRDACGREGTL